MDKTETKTVYSYDSAGLLIGTHTLDYTDRSPVSGRWQIPGNMTETAPLAAKDGYTINWTGTAWQYVEIPKVAEPTTPATPTTADTAYVDPGVLALAEAMAAQEARITALEGGASK